jgi:hypothetical protein
MVPDMSKSERKAYLAAIYKRYHQSSRWDKSKILDEFCAVCGYHRKYALRVLKRKPSGSPQALKSSVKPGPVSRYNEPSILAALQSIWLASDQLCSKRLKAAIPLWLPYYEASHGLMEETPRNLLMKMSASTIDRLLCPIRADAAKRGLSGTRPGTLLKKQIPLQTGVWDIQTPGFMEADTVAHCGNSLAGDFVWSLTMTDLCTGWTECRATWNKGSHGVISQIQDIQKSLPFELKGFDCDNGSEFLTWHLLRYFQQHTPPV